MFLENRFDKLVSLASKSNIPLRLKLWNGRQVSCSPQPTVTVFIPTPAALRFFVPPDLNRLGEAFVDGHIRAEGSIHDVFEVARELAARFAVTTRTGFQFLRRHSRSRDRKAIQYHYDVSNEFYSLFLDRHMVYSCAYYKDQNDALETAQEQKLDHILNKLMLKPGERFLDIGCGWGALIIRAAKKYRASAVGITLSRNQFDYVRERIRAEGLQERCRVELCDYRDLPDAGRFDKIASVGMFEHVGLKNLRAYFSRICALLKDDGLVLNHGIASSDIDSRSIRLGAGDFIDRYVFPDGELPHVSLALRAMAGAGIEVVDLESLRRHYARTCREWADRLEMNRSRATAIAGDRRFRIWGIYLAGCAYAFANGWVNVYQALGCKAGNTAASPLPHTRDYMYAPEGGASGAFASTA
jgi:cyclopropane-fatty-acyl-phospholipid synthase